MRFARLKAIVAKLEAVRPLGGSKGPRHRYQHLQNLRGKCNQVFVRSCPARCLQ